MAVYECETRVHAFEDVWAFHSTTDALETLAPMVRHRHRRTKALLEG